MLKPFFSIIVPTYNRVKTLQKTIKSVLNQTFTDFELLIMDDGSTDDTSIMVGAILDSRIIYEWAENSGGPARPRNRGIALARGDWICFLDADDWWTPDKLKVCFDNINERVDLIYHDLEIVSLSSDQLRRRFKKGWQLHKPILIDLLVKGNAISNSSAVIRKIILNQVGAIDERKEMIASEDYNTWLRAATITENFLYIPKTLGYYLIHDQNISGKDMSLNWELACTEFVNILSRVQKNKLMSEIQYFRGRWAFCQENYPVAVLSLKFCLLHGRPLIALKSSYMLFIIAVKSILLNRKYANK
jgi:glycosyltransferase involved in cell wall biosynthesis